MDDAPPAVSCPTDVMLECPEDTAPTNTGTATATDNCAVASVGSSDSSVPGCGSTETITRTWTATDEAGDTAQCTQTITVVDTMAPVVNPAPPIALECNSQGGIPGSDPQITAWVALASASDSCGGVTLSNDVPTFLPIDQTTVRFAAVDDCRNANSASSTVTVGDTTPPVVTCSAAAVPADDETDDPSSSGHRIISFDAADVCSPFSVSGVIEIAVAEDDNSADSPSADPTCSPIPVASGQLIEMDCGDDDCDVELDGVVLEIEAGDAVLTVTADDEFGNTGTCVVDLCARGGGNRSHLFGQTPPSDSTGGPGEAGSFTEEPRSEGSSRGTGAGRRQPEGKSRNPKKSSDARKVGKQQRR